MKKKLTAIFLCVALVAIAVAGASLAYFTDTKSATNTFTVGNVKIDLIESRFHREGNDNSGDTIPDPTHKVVADDGMKYVTTGHTMFTNDEIKEDAAKTIATTSAKRAATWFPVVTSPSAPMSSTPAQTMLMSASVS